MAKSRSFSIYLLKENFDSNNSLKEDHSLQLVKEENTNLPENAIMYISNRPANEPWWKSYWGIDNDLIQTQKGALVFLKINLNWIVLTFGSTYHQLKDESYEYDFGIITTLNALDPKKIKSTDILQPENAKRQRVQSPTASELNFFQLNNDETILKRMTGAVKEEYQNLFKNITGGNSLRISSKLQANEISKLCNDLIEIYKKDDYKSSFPELQNIVPVKDPILLSQLNSILVTAFNQEHAPMELVLAIPNIFNYETDYKVKYSGAGSSDVESVDVYIKNYREYLLEKGIVNIDSIDIFKSHKLRLLDDNDTLIEEYTIFKSLLFDCEHESNVYHLCEGHWYLINLDFLIKISNELNPFFIGTHDFLNQCEHKREDNYNNSVKDLFAEVICLDKQNISPKGQYQIEPCDLIYIKDNYLELAHIKISTRSASLSHLFNQGVNSVELLRVNNDAKNKLIELTNDIPEMKSYIESGTFRVTYGIISKKNDKKLEGLPIFSRISLYRVVNSLKTMNIPVQIFYIYDNVDRKKLNDVE